MSKLQNFNKSKKGKKRGSSSSKQDRAVQQIAKPDTSKTYNDVSWYSKSEDLLRDAASLSFNTAIGSSFDLDTKGKFAASNSSGVQYFVPGVMALNTIIGPGLSTDNSSAINIAARNVYSYVRHANSGHSNYDSPDLMMYILAMDSIYSLYNNAKRAYGIAMTYSPYNRYIPEAYVRAMGFDFNDVISNLADMRYRLNALVSKINTLCVPATFDMLKRHSWMFSNVYLDEDSPKAQSYLFKMNGYYAYNEFVETGSALNYYQFADIDSDNSGLTVAEYFNCVDTALAKIIESEDLNIMSGDILKAYGDANLFKVVPIAEDYAIMPVYNEEVMPQITNATVLDCRGQVEDMDITINPDTNTIMYNPTIVAPVPAALGKIINLHHGKTTPADVMIATRLTVGLDVPTGTAESYSMKFKALGSEFIADAEIWTKTYNMPQRSTISLVNRYVSSYENISNWDDGSSLALITHFKNHPIVILYGCMSEQFRHMPSYNYYTGIVGDLESYTVIDDAVLNRMHTTAVLSELGIG